MLFPDDDAQGRVSGVSAPRLQCGPALAVVGFGGVNCHMENVSLSVPSPCLPSSFLSVSMSLPSLCLCLSRKSFGKGVEEVDLEVYDQLFLYC